MKKNKASYITLKIQFNNEFRIKKKQVFLKMNVLKIFLMILNMKSMKIL